MDKCPHCDGGYIEYEVYDPRFGEYLPATVETVECPYCRGTGEDPEFLDAFDALCNLPGRALDTYLGVVLEADAEAMEVEPC